MLKRFWSYFANYKKYLIISCICVVFECMFELVIPLIMADIIDVGVVTRDSGYIISKGVAMVVCSADSAWNGGQFTLGATHSLHRGLAQS